ncbi:PREDICTED: cystatin-B-like [Nanorana parkeri]|uniref:cystatin-B-like n=1 Tax=Nanorana parkeri TaxID=125878 RepID=UPI000854A602|nr:PREDICTED: cystatin-B-like [Nanorana parkeri]
MPMMCGGTGAVKAADSTVQELCDQVKAELEQKHGKQFDTFVAVSYKTQLVNGTNYFVKVQVGDEEYYHVRIHKALPHEQGKVTLSTSQTGKTKEEEISYI